MTHTALVPVFAGTLSNTSTQLCDARNLHGFMLVLRDFSDWIKGRIRKFGFVDGVDFITVKNLSSPDLGSAKSRAQTLIDYHLTLDMAKELAMVENNAQGRAARRYFIECERRVLEQAHQHTALPSARCCLTPAQKREIQKRVGVVAYRLPEAKRPNEFARLHRSLKDRFNVSSYGEIAEADFDEALSFIGGAEVCEAGLWLTAAEAQALWTHMGFCETGIVALLRERRTGIRMTPKEIGGVQYANFAFTSDFMRGLKGKVDALPGPVARLPAAAALALTV